MDIRIEDRIKSVDWNQYLGPECYSPGKLEMALLHLNAPDESEAGCELVSEVLSATGNNHAGTYYPAMLEVVDFIIEMEKSSPSVRIRKCAHAILNNLYYFELEMGAYNKHHASFISGFVESRLREYADEA